MDKFRSIRSKKGKEIKNLRVLEIVKSRISSALWKPEIRIKIKQEITSLI